MGLGGGGDLVGLDGVVGEDNLLQFLGVPADFVLGELGDVVGLEQPVVLVRILLGKEERLVGAALGVKVCQIEAGVGAVFPAGREGYPPGIGGPALETLSPGGVQFVKRLGLKGLEISDIDISGIVPDMEGSVFSHAAEQVPAVR